MKKLMIGIAAIGAVLALWQVIPRLGQRMREHCEKMAAKCKERMAQFGGGEEAGAPEHCKQMAAQHKEKVAQPEAGGQEGPVREHPEPTVVGSGDRSEALSTA